jgi:hypothetical protein
LKRLALIIAVIASPSWASELYYLDRVEIAFRGTNDFYSKNCSNLAEVEGKLTNPLRYKVTLDCKTSKDRPIGLSLIISPNDIIRVIGREQSIKLKDASYYCI